MKSNHFTPFPVGALLNDVMLSHPAKLADAQKISIKYPSRLEAMALDPAKIAKNEDHIYTAGQIDLSISIYKYVSITVNDKPGSIVMTTRTPRSPLVRHAIMIIRQVLDVNEGLTVDIKEDLTLRHCGLGSSSSLIASVLSAMNELYSLPIAPLNLCRFAAQNHGEEIDGDDTHLIPVQCIGGSAVSGNFEGGLTVLAGQATPIATMNVEDTLSVVIGIPRGFTYPDSKTLMKLEEEHMEGFIKAGKEYGREIAYRLVHEVLPGLVSDDLRPIKSLVFDYRWNMGSIKNCSFVFPEINGIADLLRPLYKQNDVQLMSLSSVGPGFFVLTNDPQGVETTFKQLEMDTYITKVHNGKYEVLS